MSFAIDEEKLAKDIGLPRKILVGLRKKLVQGVDYDTVERKITYTKDGALKMARECGIKDVSPQEEKKTGPEKTVVVTVIYVKNKKYMEAVRRSPEKTAMADGEAEKDEKIVIRVRENTRFIPGMEITSEKLVYSGGALWDFVGRLPRARGVW